MNKYIALYDITIGKYQFIKEMYIPVHVSMTIGTV